MLEIYLKEGKAERMTIEELETACAGFEEILNKEGERLKRLSFGPRIIYQIYRKVFPATSENDLRIYNYLKRLLERKNERIQDLDLKDILKRK